MSSQEIKIDLFLPDLGSHMSLPYADDGIQAGFPSPAQHTIHESIDLNLEIVKHPAATFYGRVSGKSMCDEGIEPGDIIVIDRSIEPCDGDLAVCCVDGEFTLKRIALRDNEIWLMPSNTEFDPIIIDGNQRFEVWGVVTHTIKYNRRRPHSNH